MPDCWALYLQAGLELPGRYHLPGADVRPWLRSVFASPLPNADALIESLSQPEADLLETVVGVLAHAFRWASAPPLPERYTETAVTLPAGLADVWAAFGRSGGHPRVANMFQNTRTVFTTALVRFLAWNMPYHVEHHVYPAVPFHQLPALHRLMRDELRVTAAGYAAFTKGYLARRR